MNKERELERVRGRERDRQNTFGIKKKNHRTGREGRRMVVIYIYIYIKA
jgi:hypothetical protein